VSGARRSGPASLILFLLLAVGAPGVVLAGDPPAGVVLDATVTVNVTFEIPDTIPVSPLEGATVTLIAARTDFPEETLQELTATTNDDGVAVFEGVARADGGQPAVHLTIAASHEFTSQVGDCIETTSLYGQVSDVLSSDGLVVDVAMFPSSSLVCAPPTGEELPAGLVADAGIEATLALDGTPITGSVFAFITWHEWTWAIEAYAIDGAAVFEGLPRPVDPSDPVDVQLTAVGQVDEVVDGCTFDRTAQGGASLAIAEAGTYPTSIDLVRTAFQPPTLDQGVVVVDRAGDPVGGGSLFVLQEHPDGATEPWSCNATVNDEGLAIVPLYDWGSADAPSEVGLEVHGPVTSTEVRGDCVLSFGPYGLTSFGQVAGVESAAVEIVTDILELDAVCSATGEPPASGGGVGGGEPTLPPTDAVGPPARTHASILPALLAILALIAAGGLAASFVRPGRRRS
jgi:hypothetical protein